MPRCAPCAADGCPSTRINRSPLQIVRDAEAAGARTPAAVVAWVVEQLKSGTLRFAVEDPDAPENWPRVWFIWRGHALMSSAKGHEDFLRARCEIN